MTLTKPEKRILEIWFHHFYMWYISNNARHNHGHFLLLPSLLQTNMQFDEDLIADVWKAHLLSNPTPPTIDETLLAMGHTQSKLFKCSRKMFAPFYQLKSSERSVKMQSFRKLKVELVPKIHHETFHQNLLTYLKQMCYITTSLGGLINGL